MASIGSNPLCSQIRCVEDQGSVRCVGSQLKFEYPGGFVRRGHFEMWNWLLGVLWALAAVSAFSPPLLAQANGHALAQWPAANAQDTPPRPDISGVWNATSGLYEYAAFSKDEPPM